jgi:hypothetical protein
LAIAIAGGIGGSSLLALYFTPALYLLLFGNQGKSKGDRAIATPAPQVPEPSNV